MDNISGFSVVWCLVDWANVLLILSGDSCRINIYSEDIEVVFFITFLIVTIWVNGKMEVVVAFGQTSGQLQVLPLIHYP